jgi:hypothetical protein
VSNGKGNGILDGKIKDEFVYRSKGRTAFGKSG